MGNSGSAHNLQNEYVESELNSYYTQQYLRRITGERIKKFNQDAFRGWSSGKNITNCKVLPKPAEKLKLRATSNGAILQAGGTISFRAKDQADLPHKNEATGFHPMRRCHTLILSSQTDTISQRDCITPPDEFRRSQTLLNIGYNRNKSSDNILTPNENPSQLQAQNAPTTSTLKVNKYNKKRKAPTAPSKMSSKVDTNNASHNLLSGETKKPSLPKPRIYSTNSNKSIGIQKQLELPTIKIAPFQRDCNIRTSVNYSRQVHQTSSPGSIKLPYRREKSFDAKLLRQKETDICSVKRASAPIHRDISNVQNVNKSEENSDRSAQVGNAKKKLVKEQKTFVANKNSTTFTSTYCPERNYLREKHKGEESQFNLNKDSKKSDDKKVTTLTNERKAKTQQSRIPQLKRTFYFGMESSNKYPISKFSPTQRASCRRERMYKENEDIMNLNHNTEVEEEILDNGILVHVRPTLPRRQPEAPNFSPAAAWKNLLDKQQPLHPNPSRSTQNITNGPIIETPISLTSGTNQNYIKVITNWTPQQDLDDDDENESLKEQNFKTENLVTNLGKDLEDYSNSLHIFSLSLPRDVHLQCRTKFSPDCMAQQNNLKAGNCWLVPRFNSLKKLKTHLGNNVDFRSNIKCTCAPKNTTKRNSTQFRNIFCDSFTAEWKSNHQPDCELNKTSPRRISDQNENWLLHKSKSNEDPLAVTYNTLDNNCLETLKSLPVINFEPKSLTNICGGRHIVYLPGQHSFTSSTQGNEQTPKQTTIKPTCVRPRQRQGIIRENLQDITPVPNTHQSNVSVTEKNTHRFSFQSTVRVLEKRRLAEKLSKDAEIQEAQRLNELEVMKRVEEDFQRKRAPEKANLRNQLRLHLKASTENGEYRSLPLNINDNNRQFEQRNLHTLDENNNIFCRAEPDGAISTSLDCNDNLPKITQSKVPYTNIKSSKESECFEFDGVESEGEIHRQDLQCTTLLIEPYLQSII